MLKLVTSNSEIASETPDDFSIEEGLELLADYRRISDPERRRDIMRLVKEAADARYPFAPPTSK